MNKTVFVDYENVDGDLTFRDKIVAKLQSSKEWIIRNKYVIVTLAPAVVGGITTITKVVIKHNNLRKEAKLKELYCYDRSLGHYWRLKRKLSNREWVTVDKRRTKGERLADILSEMDVLK